MKRKVIETSVAAFHSLEPEKLNERYRLILFALGRLGEATSETVSAYVKKDHEVMWKRFSELQKMELIYRTDNKKLNKSGRLAFTWCLTERGRLKTENQENALKRLKTSQPVGSNDFCVSQASLFQ